MLVEDSQSKARVILDPGSQSSLITNRLCLELQLDRANVSINLEAINSVSCQIKHKYRIKVASVTVTTNFTCQVLLSQRYRITGSLPSKIIVQNLQIPATIKLADLQFYVPVKVNLLIGADCFWNLLCIGQMRVGKIQLTMQKT